MENTLITYEIEIDSSPIEKLLEKLGGRRYGGWRKGCLNSKNFSPLNERGLVKINLVNFNLGKGHIDTHSVLIEFAKLGLRSAYLMEILFLAKTHRDINEKHENIAALGRPVRGHRNGKLAGYPCLGGEEFFCSNPKWWSESTAWWNKVWWFAAFDI